MGIRFLSGTSRRFCKAKIPEVPAVRGDSIPKPNVPYTALSFLIEHSSLQALRVVSIDIDINITMENFTDTQMKTLAIMPKFSAAMGIAGDLIVITEILVFDRPNKIKQTIHRLLLAMSICDLISSFGFFLSTWPIPKEEEGLFYNVGNQATCVWQGFIIQFSISVPLLNMCLAIYYLLVINFSWKEEKIRKKIEPFFYVFSFSIAIATCSAAVALDLFNNANLWCWIAATPSGCNQSYDSRDNEEPACLRGDNAELYRWFFFYALIWFALLFVGVIMYKVYLTFRKLETTNARYATALSSDGGKRAASRARQVGTQGICYVGAMYITFFFPTINRSLEQFAGITSFPVEFLHSMTIPSQGFWNFLVYIRPRFIKYRSDHPGVTVWGTLKAILYDQYKANIHQNATAYTLSTAPGPDSNVPESGGEPQDDVHEVAEDGQD
jgi:hypothetical protein